MNFLLDEELLRSCTDVFRSYGHEASRVVEIGLREHPDTDWHFQLDTFPASEWRKGNQRADSLSFAGWLSRFLPLGPHRTLDGGEVGKRSVRLEGFAGCAPVSVDWPGSVGARIS